MLKKVADFTYHSLLLAIGSLLCAVAVNGILVPNEFLSGGLTGVALIIFYHKPIVSVGILYLLINIPVFILGWFFAGTRFVLYTAWGMLIFAAALSLWGFELPVTDRMLGAVVAGGLSGAGVAIMMRSYGSAGGSEILCVVLHKLFGLSLGTGSLLINTAIMLIAALLFPLQNVLYTLVFIAVSAQATDMVFHGLARRQAALIISEHWSPIVQEMTNGARLGVTLLSGRGGFEGCERTILYSVVNRTKVPQLKRMVTDIDPNAFIAIMDASDVTGERVGNQPHW